MIRESYVYGTEPTKNILILPSITYVLCFLLLVCLFSALGGWSVRNIVSPLQFLTIPSLYCNKRSTVISTSSKWLKKNTKINT